MTVSRVAVRRKWITGVAQRTISSTAVGGDAVEVGGPERALVGVLGEREHAVADRVARRLVAGDDEQDEERAELARRELVPAVLVVDLGLHERGRDVVARVVEPVLARASRPYWNSSMPARHQLFDRLHVLGVADAEDDVRELEDPLGVARAGCRSCRR